MDAGEVPLRVARNVRVQVYCDPARTEVPSHYRTRVTVRLADTTLWMSRSLEPCRDCDDELAPLFDTRLGPRRARERDREWVTLPLPVGESILHVRACMGHATRRLSIPARGAIPPLRIRLPVEGAASLRFDGPPREDSAYYTVSVWREGFSMMMYTEADSPAWFLPAGTYTYGRYSDPDSHHELELRPGASVVQPIDAEDCVRHEIEQGEW